MQSDDARYTIGQLARRTGVPVRTIRFYSDAGLIPPAGRTEAGYRLYGLTALMQLDLVRTLRELGIDLATIRRVLAREASIAEIAAAHAGALDVQIRTLRTRRAVLRAVAKQGANPEEVRLMHRLAQLSDAERRRLIQEFVDEVYAGLDADPGMEAMMRSAMPDLPEDPTPEQVGAWVELAELVADPDFRRTIRAMAERAAADRAAGRAPWDGSTGQQLAEKARAALAAGVAADAAAARPWLDDICATAASAAGQADGPSFRAAMRERLRAGTDARAERYWRLLGIINGWPAWPDTVPAFEWVIAALDADAARA